jgi:mannose/cellobiose epimerase-like protein (N-acyl-D-glucosamine 2-epimerase family)
MKHRPDFRSPAFLRQHALDTMAFYDGRCVDPMGGFYHYYKDDGEVYDSAARHLVSSTRFVVTHAWAARHFPEHDRANAWREAARHGLRFLRQAHRDAASGGYAWRVHVEHGQKTVMDATNHCYGLAFVLLAHAEALRAGVDEAMLGLDETFGVMEQRFWEADTQLYADEATADWKLSRYRGQNANMHACEAMLAAFEATDEVRYLQRASELAESVTQHLAARCGDQLIWEHYQRSPEGPWQPDWQYNKDDSANLFRPWGFQTGHLAEWAKLLLTLERQLPTLDPDNWLVHRARALFAAAVDHGWDKRHGGLVYGFAPDDAHLGLHHHRKYHVCDGDKYHWVQAETLAAAAALGERTGEGAYWDWYDRIWAYCWDHFVDHQHGAWFRILGPDNGKRTDEKSPAGKADYHNLGACFEALARLDPAVA